MTGILDKIIRRTREDLSIRKKEKSISDLRSLPLYEKPRRDFGESLKVSQPVTVIAEFKRASPAKGIIRPDCPPDSVAISYETNGARAVSVLTDKPFFQGGVDDLAAVSQAIHLPVLRKDFIVDFYQIEEARAWGADAVLLIVKITDGSQLFELHDAAVEAGLQTLVECYDRDDWERLDFDRFGIVGVNNRNLNNFEVNLHQGVSLLQTAPGGVIRVSESGIGSPKDLTYLQEQGIHCALIGETLMRAEYPGLELARFLGTAAH